MSGLRSYIIDQVSIRLSSYGASSSDVNVESIVSQILASVRGLIVAEVAEARAALRDQQTRAIINAVIGKVSRDS